ncbi:plasmid replication protein RepC [Paracoccus sp. DMF-8]|uniref:plasmid replication protein RepC n=1 Tax=Paracoccus sp. DMF-8 TaxID=3019445 RepID=UPI0023E8B5C8|nr:plasmid replication protein RepC [Paracoccus sp. DMF-8]MDF3604713.1 plasmid replication protein RepC [Paracoccus sp. DMF-8]
MDYVPLTSFRRPIDAVVMQHHSIAATPMPAHAVNKWDALREITTARKRLGLTDRDLTVLQALLSFHPGTALDDPTKLVVFPSNRAICERLNGMPCSTMRRHLARLIDSGLLLRRDSPNGKRYQRRIGNEAFGFDLSPLARRFAEFATLAESVQAEARQIAHLRETIRLMRRDLLALIEATEASPAAMTQIDQLATILRRQLEIPALEQIITRLKLLIDELRHAANIAPVTAAKTAEMGTTDSQNEQHQQRSNNNPIESEKGCEQVDAANAEPDLPLSLIASACPEVFGYAQHPVRHWHGFVDLVEKVRPMMGIATQVWQDAKQVMGIENAAVTLAAMLQRFGEIRSAGAYLRILTAKARDGGFSVRPMVMAALRREPGMSSQL